ncbi:hypothetical protein OKW43_002827 [Paraburkholderia sp. WC7.3g]
MKLKLASCMSFLLSACLVAGTAHAEELSGTLKKIKDSGVITLGARESAAPFSYRVQGTEFAGYSYDIMMKVVDRIKTELKAPNLQVKVIPFTAQNRIPLIQNGTLDLECSTTTNTPERQKQVAFGVHASLESQPGHRHSWPLACLDQPALVLWIKAAPAAFIDMRDFEREEVKIVWGHVCVRKLLLRTQA